MNKIKVLFLCIHNSARSQMAESYLKKFGNDKYEVESAGLEPGKLNPLAVNAMQLDGIDISKNAVKDVFEMKKAGKSFNYVITVCDAAHADQCPVFPGLSKKIAWMFDDPSAMEGTPEEKLAGTIKVRDQIKERVLQFVKEIENR